MKAKGLYKVSIVVPVYNAEKFLKKCVESVTDQSYKEIELILVNDGSTDSSIEICKKYTKKDKRISLITQENSGPAAARNNGIIHANGDFIFFLDADDFIDKNTISILIENYEKYNPDMVMGNFGKLENNGKLINQNVSFSPDNKLCKEEVKILLKNQITSYIRHFLKFPSNHLISYCWCRLYKLSVIKKYKIKANKTMHLFEDFVFNLEYLTHTKKIIFVNKPLYTYVMHNDTLSASMKIMESKSLIHDMKIFKEKTKKYLKDIRGINNEIGHTLVHYSIIFIVRTCRYLNVNNFKKIYSEINKFINSPILVDSLNHYSPKVGNSKIIPLLMKYKLVIIIMFIGKQKAYKRYGKPKNK